MPKSSRRHEILAKRNVHKDTYIEEWPDAGLIMIDSPADPQPGLKLDEEKRIIELDGRPIAAFDMMDHFITRYGIDTAVAEEAMNIASENYARMLVDIHVSREEIARLIKGITPAKLVDIMRHLNVVEMMMALQKMRVRKTPANQAHVTFEYVPELG